MVMTRGAAAGTASVAVIGAGPCGLAAAIALKQAGLRVEVYDRSCVASSVASYPTYMTFFSTAEKISIGGLPFVTAGEKPTRREALAYYRMVVQYFNLVLRLYEPVNEIVREGEHFVVRSQTPRGAAETPFEAVVMATGYFGTPNLLHVPGESLPHVTHLYHEGHDAFRRDAVVVGGGNSAVDAALDLWRCGAKVTLVHFREHLDDNVKPWVLPDITNRLKDGSIAGRWNARVTRIDVDTVSIDGPQGPQTLRANHVYLMTGFTPNTGLLQQLGVSVDAATGIPAHDKSTMETDVERVFVAGVLASGYDANKVFIENGRGHGVSIARRLAAGRPVAAHG
ncbi:MAG: YpdA family putative bacillithiol disulfide reductase [Gemmatimonadales bacterium]|jgi:thioredoxin reductase (NADPH)